MNFNNLRGPKMAPSVSRCKYISRLANPDGQENNRDNNNQIISLHQYIGVVK